MYSCILSRSRDKPKSLYIHYHNACSYQTSQGGYIRWVSYFRNWHNPLIRQSSKVMQNVASIISLLQQGLWPPKLARWWLIMRSFHRQSYTTFWTLDHMRPCDKLKNIISTTAVPMATNPRRVVITQSCKITWQIRCVTSTLPQWLWLPNMAGWFYTMKIVLQYIQ